MRNKEDKYMNVNVDTIIGPLGPTTGPQAVSVAAFATTATAQTGQINPVQYCGRDIHNMHMLRPFNSTSAEALRTNIIDGSEVKPTVARSMFNISRMAIDVGGNVDQALAAANAYKTCPIRCRVIRVTPKLQAGITTSIDPTNDLFLNQTGEKYGCTDASFSMSDAENATVNYRVYTTIADEKFTIAAAPVVNSLGAAATTWTAQVSRPEGSFCLVATTHISLLLRRVVPFTTISRTT